MEKIKYVLFDCWDSVINFNQVSEDAILNNIYKHVINKEVLDFQTFKNEYLTFLDEYYSSAKYDVNQVAIINYFCTNYGLILDCSLEQASIDSSLGFKADLVENIQLFLDFLKENNIRCSILSNTIHSKDITVNLVNRNFEQSPFEHIICSSEYAVKKPDVRFFNLASKIIEVENKNIAFIGDNFFTDIIGSSKANMQSFFLNQKEKKIDPKLLSEIKHTEFKNYKDLIEIFKKKI